MFKIKEQLSNVDLKSAGIGATVIVAGYGLYKGVKYLTKVGKEFMAARKLERESKAEEVEVKTQNEES